MRIRFLRILTLAVSSFLSSFPTFLDSSPASLRPGTRVLLDAHNCYPYYEWWFDRIDRALSAGTPLAIEQDLLWAKNPRKGEMTSLVSHGALPTGTEPGMREYFFERVRPIVEKALHEGNHGDWPLITLNLDLKSEEPEHLAAIWQLLAQYQDWLTTAQRTGTIDRMETLEVRPVLVLTGESDAQKAVFYDQVAEGGKLFVFGAVRTNTHDPSAPPEGLAPNPADNYHRWWNNSWRVVEPEGQSKAGDWTVEKESRLSQLVRYAHGHNLWIRFYTLDGATKQELSCNGWFSSYNFGSREAVRKRWEAAAKLGVDYIASDQYEELGALLKSLRPNRATTKPNPFSSWLAIRAARLGPEANFVSRVVMEKPIAKESQWQRKTRGQ